ncbi:MAG: 2-oxoacid:acceptor oxidoreductase family protein [Defluviitaleaceae bacterium]|nr:2-oxoacid:acceptor oxidoreductase family protein [Defluviitaleaceae bacterium]
MTTKIIFSGFGGQGILTLGQIVATIAMKKGHHVTWMPSYGAEMRGGTANCAVVISDKLIGSPLVDTNIDALCAMNDASVTKFLSKVKPGGNAFINSSIVTESPKRDDITIREIDATNIATKVGNPKVANMVMLSGFLKDTDLFTMEDIEGALHDTFGQKYPKLIPLNIEAIKAGA